MKTTNQSESIQRIRDFLRTVSRMKGSALVYSSRDLMPAIIKEIKSAFPQRKTHFIDMKMSEKEEIDRVFETSLKEGSLLLISLDQSAHPDITRRLEQIFEDGCLQLQKNGEWRKVEPTETWQTVVWIDRDQIKEDEFALRRVFVHKLVV